MKTSIILNKGGNMLNLSGLKERAAENIGSIYW
jgi:hypothetical protein